MSLDWSFDSYKRYKRGTATFTTWLAEAAKTCGASIETYIGKSRPAPKTKKRKARSNKIPERDIPAKQLVELANVVAQSAEPKITVPLLIYHLLGEVITLRKEAATIFGQVVTDDSRDEDGHSYFIGILEQVREILSPLAEKAPISKQKDSTTPQNLANIFEALDLEEPSEDSSSSLPVSTTAIVPARPARKPSAETYNIEPTLSDAFMCSLFFFQDLASVRALIRNLWTDYSQGRASLITATLVTNTAMERIERNVNELFATMAEWRHLQVPNQDKWIEWVYNHIASAIKSGHYGKQETDKINFAADFVCIPTLTRIQMFSKSNKGKLPILTGKIMPPFVYLLITELNVMSVLAIEVPPGMDAITRAFATNEASIHKDMPVWVVFGIQILLDINNVLEQDQLTAFRELQATGERLITSIRNFFQFKRTMKSRHDKWHQDNDSQMLQMIQFISTWIMKDHVGECTQKKFGKNTELVSFNLLKNHPLFCGSLIYWLNTSYQGFGIDFATTYDSIPCAAHLYNAAKQSKYLQTTWSDMEYIISAHKEERIFVGNRPSEPADYFKRFTIAFGASATNFSQNRRSYREGDISKNTGNRGLAVTGPIQDIFDHRYCQMEQYADLSDAKLGRLIRELRLKHPEMDDYGWPKHKKLTSVQLLTILTVATADEDLHLHFDYISMEIRCAKLYSSIRDRFIADSLNLENLAQAVSSALGEDQDSHAGGLQGPPPSITGYLKDKIPESPFKAILLTKAIFFADPAAANATRSIKGFTMQHSMLLKMAGVTLERASKCMKEVVETEGTVELSKAEAVSVIPPVP